MSKSLSIIFLSRSYYPNIGGVEKHIYELSKVLVSRGYKITIITEDPQTTEQLDLKESGYELKNVTVIHIRTGRNNWFKKFRIWQGVWHYRELFLNANLTHCHDVFFWYLPIALIYPLKPVYTTFHGYESYPIKLKSVIYRKLFEYMSNKTICVGDFMRKWYYAHPNLVIYGGTDIRKKTIGPKKHSAIFIGRLDEHTGIETYVNAVKLIRKSIPSFTLTVYGDGPYKDKIKGEGIIIKGFDKDADKEIEKYEFAFVSRYLAILEAMAAKRLVIAVYDNPIKKDYLEMTPYKDWIIIIHSAEELAAFVVSSISGKVMMSEKVQAAYQWVGNHSWDAVADEYEKLWKK